MRYTLRERKFQGTKVPRSESSIVLSFTGAKRPGGERARERIGHGTKGPGSESSRERIGQGPIGRFAPGERIGPGAKRLGTINVTPDFGSVLITELELECTDKLLKRVMNCLVCIKSTAYAGPWFETKGVRLIS